MKTYSEFAGGHGVTLSYERAGINPNMRDGNMDHWRVALSCDGKRMTVPFSKGYGHGGSPPTVEEVLECLACDSASVENAQNFADWSGECGGTRATYKACISAAERLQNLLGKLAYNELLWGIVE